jgi:hypothetical protein
MPLTKRSPGYRRPFRARNHAYDYRFFGGIFPRRAGGPEDRKRRKDEGKRGLRAEGRVGRGENGPADRVWEFPAGDRKSGAGDKREGGSSRRQSKRRLRSRLAAVFRSAARWRLCPALIFSRREPFRLRRDPQRGRVAVGPGTGDRAPGAPGRGTRAKSIS